MTILEALAVSASGHRPAAMAGPARRRAAAGEEALMAMIYLVATPSMASAVEITLEFIS